MKKEVETILGFDIPVRKLTKEESNRLITIERFDSFHTSAGEDFVDNCGSTINTNILGGYLMCKHPELSTEILNALNDKYSEPLKLKHLYDDENDFYCDLAEFINLTTHLKARINQILIQVDEYYNKN